MLYTVPAPCSWQILHFQAIYFRIKLPSSMKAASRMRRRDSGSSKNSRRFGSSKKDMGRTCVARQPPTAAMLPTAPLSGAPSPIPQIEIAGDCVPIGGVSHGHALNLLKEIYGIPGGSEHTAVVIELPPGIGIVRREFLILFHQLCPELLLCLRFLRFMVGVVLVVVRKRA